MPTRLGLNEIMIVNPTSIGDIDMLHRGQMGHLAQTPDYDDEDLFGLEASRLGQDLDDDLYGTGSMQGAGLGICDGCAGEQMGYFSDGPDHELIGTYCPSCGKVGMGNHSSHMGEDMYEDDIDGIAQYADEEDLYLQGVGQPLGQDLDEEIPGIEDWPAEQSVGRFAEDDLELLEGVGQYDEGEIDGYGQYDDDDLFGFGQYENDEVDGYVEHVPSPHNPHVNFGRLSGYEPERSVNPTVELRRSVPATPVRHLPSFFKPYF